MCTIVTTNVIAAAMQRTDMTYLGGTLRRIKNRMSSKRKKEPTLAIRGVARAENEPPKVLVEKFYFFHSVS